MKEIIFSLILFLFSCSSILAQDVPTSLGPAPNSTFKITEEPTPFLQVGTRYFSQISVGGTTFQFGKAFLESCTITNIGAPYAITFPGGLLYYNGKVYTWNQSSPFQLYLIDTVTGTHTVQFNLTGVPQSNLTGMYYDGTTVYGVSSSLAVSQIFSVNMTTGVCTPIGSPSATCAGAIFLTGRLGAQYSAFSVDIVLDNLYKWNKSTGVATLVGPIGGNANFGQDACFDNNDNKLYWMSYTTGPQLRTIDTATGTAGTVLCTYTAQATGIVCLPPAGSPILYGVPELIYYKFENNTSTATPNYASAPVGTNPALLVGSCVFSTGGQFDSCISGTAGAGAGLNTGWNTAMPPNWTISFWLGPNQVDANPSYLWGDPTAGSFRCFYGGAAYPNNILFRGGFADILITGVNPTATVVHLVYDGTNVVVYKNGVLFNTFPRTVTANGSAPFKVAGYSTSSSISGKMDEFRLYNRALTAAEVLATWNQELPIMVGTNNNQNNVPSAYNLSQNYPNPFNPTTTITFSLPKEGYVEMKLFDITGKEVATLVSDPYRAGIYSVKFDASGLASGVYFYKITVGEFTATKKMVLIK